MFKTNALVSRALACAAFLFGLAHVALAGTNSWTAIGPDGGRIHDLGFHSTDPAMMYAATSGGFYRSSNAGASWQRVVPSPLSYYFRPVAVATGAGGPDHVHVISGTGEALRSEDRGATLRYTTGQIIDGTQPRAPNSYAIATAPDNSAIYYAVDMRVFRSVDGGVSRQLRGIVPGDPDFPISTLRVAPSDPNVIYLAHYNAAHRSTDAGANWTPIFTRVSPSDGVWSLTPDPRNANRIWLGANDAVKVSDDAGVTWRSVLAEVAVDLDVDPQNSQIIYVTTFGRRLLRTTDGGANWIELSTPPMFNGVGAPRFAIHPADSARLYLFGNTGLFASTDAGTTWSPVHQGIIATTPSRFSRTGPVSGRVFFSVMEYGIGSLRLADNDVDVRVSPSLSQAAGGSPPFVTNVLSLPTALIAALDNERIAISRDSGSTWTLASTRPAARTSSLAAASNGAWTLFAATGAGIYRSDDLGDHWTASSNGLPSGAATWDVAVAADQTTVYASIAPGIAATNFLYRSVDGGQSWSSTTLEKRGLFQLAPHPTDARTLLIGTNEGAFKTTDGGVTFQPLELFPSVTDAPVGAIAIDPVDPNIIYVETLAATGNVVRSVDGGARFQRLMPDYYDGGTALSLIVDPERTHRVLAAVDGGGVREISLEPDLQLTVTPRFGNATPNSPVEFNIAASNRGPFDATGVQVEVRLPTGTTATSATSNGNACVIAENVVTCRVGLLRFEQSAAIRVNATPTAEGSFAATASVSGAQPDSASANNSASGSFAIASAPPPRNSGGGGGGSFGAQSLIALLLIGLFRTLHSGCRIGGWCRLQESNPRPTDYKSVALPTELSRQNQ
jgi:uncharacterized repeat protein (TIGR01451 family)